MKAPENWRADLLPCPFCGSPAFLRPHGNNANLQRKVHRVSCGKSSCGVATIWRKNPVRAIADWNCRAAAEAQP